MVDLVRRHRRRLQRRRSGWRLADFLHASKRYYTSIGDVRVQLVYSGDRLLPELSPALGKLAERKMRDQGIDVRLNARCTRVDDRGITLADGDVLTAGTVICTIGTAPNPVVADLALPKIRGRPEVAADMSVPKARGVWAIGDCAAVPNAFDGSVSPPTAQFAERQARLLAANILRKLRGEPTKPFSYRPLGQLSAIGLTKPSLRSWASSSPDSSRG
jgi:NADH dehydrogenase